MKTRCICFMDPSVKPYPDEYFVTHVVPERLRSRLLTYLHTQRPDLPGFQTVSDAKEGVFLDVCGSVFQPKSLVTFTTKRGYKVWTFLSHAHAVCAQLRNRDYTLVEDRKGKPFVIVPGMHHGAVLWLDDVEDVANAFALRAQEGATLYEGARSQAIAGGHVYAGRLMPRPEAAPQPETYPPGTRVRVTTASRPTVSTGEVIEEGWDTKGGCKVRHDDGPVYGWGWSELVREDVEFTEQAN